MKKYFILTSVLALTACGGGSGGGSETPTRAAVPDTSAFLRVDSDTGVGMMDFNRTRVARYSQARAMTHSIESESNIDSGALGLRAASINRAPISPLANTNFTQEEIDHAYEMISDIFLNHNIEGYTNHDILLSLALVFVNESQILNLLNMYQGNNLADKIQGFLADINSENRSDEANEVITNAEDIYQDFGNNFIPTLNNAKFYLNSNDDEWYTFALDENNNLIGIEEKDGNIIPKDSKGVFEKRVNGYEYVFSFEGAEFSGKIEKVYDTEPAASVLKADLLAEINEKWADDAHLGDITTILNNATIYAYTDVEEEEIDNHIVGRHADYKEKIRIETGSKDLGLKYSDFGLRYEQIEFYQNDDMLRVENLDHYVYSEHGGFVGGYEGKMATPESEMTFKGDAYVGLTRKQSDAELDESDPIEPYNNYYKGTADLIVKTADNPNNLDQKLIADFSDAGWYKVIVNNIPLNATGGEITFDNTKGKTIDEKWQADPNTQNGQLENMNIKYYGAESSNPTESVGFIQYLENKVSDSDWTFKADITFGTKKNVSE